MDIPQILLGRRLANREWHARRIGAFEGVPTMGLDALGSSAYGPEAALAILAPLGAAGLAWVGWIMAPVVAVLVMLFLSYRQTIGAYPSSGGAYVVARDNLGTNASLLAAAALLVDYVLNVAVGISAGVGALISAIPSLQPHILALCLGILALITLLNLRGTLESGRLLAVPTYAFVASFALVIGVGVVRTAFAGSEPRPLVAPAPLAHASEAVGVWLLLRAFAAGCTAMTGIEAVSNGMGAFRDPAVRYGRRTLAAIVAILGLFLAGIAWLTHAYRIGAMDQTKAGYRSVLAQLAGATVGDGVLYHVALASLLAVLALSANTSFVGFPRLCRALAADGCLPEAFGIAGRRLVFSGGILFLSGCAALLLVAFAGITDRLIPLFAVGAFLSFTISQTAMAAHWRAALRSETASRAHRARLAVNAAGAAVTGAALVIIVVAKFIEGAWIVALVIPAVVALLKAIRRYYDALYVALSDLAPIDASPGGLIVVVAVEAWNRHTHKAVELALGISPDVYGVHLAQLAGPGAGVRLETLRALWRKDVVEPAEAARRKPPALVVLEAQRRMLHEPLLDFVRELGRSAPARRIAIVIPVLVRQRWYQHVLHAQRARRLRAKLVAEGGANVTVVEVPWRLDEKQTSASA